MNLHYLILLFGLFSLVTFIISLQKNRRKETILAKPYKLCQLCGSFVWADHSIFGLFWFIVSLVCFLLQDILLFLLFFSTFWLVRSIGETIYWFFQQFSPRVGNEPDKFWTNKFVPGEAVWFINQIYWQCITVVALIATMYLSFLWLKTL